MSALAWPAVDVLLEAGADGPARRVQRAARAAAEIVRDFHRLEGETTQQLLTRLRALKRELMLLLAERLTAADTASLDGVIRQVDRLIADATADILAATARPYRAAATLGQSAGDQPMRALQIQVGGGLPGAGDPVVTAASDNTLDLLTPPMRQFASEIKTGLRRIALAGGQRMEEIQRLQAQLAGQGFDHAAFRAERIIRTELGRVFGEATYARMVDLARTFAFLKKAWTATKDSRTRLGHLQAAETYARGKGLAIADRFRIPVHQEGKAGTKLLGVALLRFPIDPLAEPAGRIAAAATILCRCHAVIDVDPTAFAEFTRAQVQFAMGKLPFGSPGAPPPAALPPAPTPRLLPPRPARPPRPAKPTRPRITKRWPATRSVAQKLGIPAGPRWDVARSAMDAVELVHGDGPLSRLPLTLTGRTDLYGYVRNAPGYGTIDMALSGLGFTAHPHLTLWHETGHWLDFMGVAKGSAVHPGRRGGLPRRAPPAAAGATRISFSSAADLSNRLLDGWRAAVDASQAVQTLKQWQRLPLAARPTPLSTSWLHEALTHEELFARSYAQWIALRSQHATGLAELRGLQQLPYPRQWQEADFAPIADAFDRLFELLGWRTPGTIRP